MANQGGRPKKAEGEARDAVMRVRVKTASKAKFEAVARSRGMSATDAHRTALAEWVARNQ